MRFFIPAVLLIGLLAPPSVALADQPGWIADAQNGCRVWNAHPKPNESVTWSGACRNGFAQGEGVEQWFENGQPSIRYEGEFRHGKHNGHGIQTFDDGRRYEGDYRDGMWNGHGVETSANGDRFEGEFRDGKLNDHGVETFADGGRFEGEFRDDRWNGHGVFTAADGGRYEGEFRDGKPNGPMSQNPITDRPTIADITPEE